MLSWMEIMIIGGASYFLLKRHAFREWIQAGKESVDAFKTALKADSKREIKEVSEFRSEKSKEQGDQNAR